MYDPQYDWKETDHEKFLDETAPSLIGILDHLYGRKPFDEGKLEDCIEELCHLLDVRMPKGELIVRPMAQNEMLSDWVKFNNEYLKKLA